MGTKPTKEPVNPVTDGLARDFPRLWQIARDYDFAERLGGCSDPLYAEVDAAMRELWNARVFIQIDNRLESSQ